MGIRCGTPRVLFPPVHAFYLVSPLPVIIAGSERRKNKGMEEEEEGCLDHISGPVTLTRRRVFPFISFLFGKLREVTSKVY